jgi:hypothetical protein
MYTTTTPQLAAQQRRPMRSRVSYIIKEDYSDLRHRSGINGLALDTISVNTDGGCGVLYTASRDSTINAWDLHIDFARLREESELKDREKEAAREAVSYIFNPVLLKLYLSPTNVNCLYLLAALHHCANSHAVFTRNQFQQPS